MLFEQTMEKLYALKMDDMAQAMEEQRQQADIGELSFEERLGLLVDRQWIRREDRALTRRLRNAKLPQPAFNICLRAGLRCANLTTLSGHALLRHHLS